MRNSSRVMPEDISDREMKQKERTSERDLEKNQTRAKERS